MPHYLRNPAANFLTLVAPRTAEVEALSLDGLLLLFTPAEPTVAAAAAIRERLAPGAPAGTLLSVVGLAQGYVGYLETEARVKEGTGEARRTYFGGALPARVGDGLSRAVEAISAKPSR